MNFPLLLDLTLRGSLVLIAVTLADALFARTTTARWRRVWWLLVPVAFLVPCAFPHPAFPYVIGYNGVSSSPDASYVTAVHVQFDLYHGLQIPVGPLAAQGFSWIVFVWLGGATLAALQILISTWRVQQQWKQERFSTDPTLLNLLEDAKAAAGVTAPIGLIVSARINTPALLGWLRPRILLPSHLADSGAHELKAILLHELAHFKSLDIPGNWLFAAVRVIHWFNPLAYLASAAWSRFVEEAADESAIRWMHAATGTAYGEILLKTLGSCPGGPVPYGALAIGESIATLKRRILMIRHYPAKSNRGFAAAAVILALGALLAFAPTLAVAANEDQDAAKKTASDAMQVWLTEIDAGDYAKSWTDSAQSFQKALTSEAWVTALTNVRQPLGKSLGRKQVSAAYQNVVPNSSPEIPLGKYVIAQYESSFENMKSAMETVTFEQQPDGSWRAAGYLIKPH